MNLTNIHRIKAFLGITKDTQNNLLRQIVQSVSLMIEKSPFFDRHIEKLERTEYFDVEAGQKIISLKGVPIELPTAGPPEVLFKIWHDTAREFADSTLIDSSDYYIDEETGKIKVDGYTLSAGKGCLKIQYTGGLAVHTDRMVGTNGAVTGTFVVNEEVVGGTSGAVGKLISQSGTAISIDVVSGVFEVNETVTGAGGAFCVIATITQTPLIMLYPDLALACDMQAGFVFQRKNELGLRSTSVEGGSITTHESMKLLPAVKNIIRTYRRSLYAG